MLRYVYDSTTDIYELDNVPAQIFALEHNIPIMGKGIDGWYHIVIASEGAIDLIVEHRYQPHS